MAVWALKPQSIVAIVDDDPGMLASLSNLLLQDSVFTSAEDWFDRGASAPADCRLVDVELGGISGIELQRRVKASGSTPPVIRMTGYYDEATRAQALQTGCASFLWKPVVPAELIGRSGTRPDSRVEIGNHPEWHCP